MDLFCFASRSETNIDLGINARTWAVAPVSQSAMRGRVTKAAKYFGEGSRGLLYCVPTHSFTTPFIAESGADSRDVITHIWRGSWVLPFQIRPLGNLSRQLHMHEAQARWPVLQRAPARSVSAAMNFTGTTVFVPVEISDEDWDLILDDLAIPS